jgi:phage-related baseplate assembly protein
VVDVVLMGQGGTVADQPTIDAVTAYIQDEKIRPDTDYPQVRSVTVLNYVVTGVLYLYAGPSPNPVLAQVTAQVAAFTLLLRQFGHSVMRDALKAQMILEGIVHSVDLPSPLADIAVAPDQVAVCTGINLTYGGTRV